MTTPDVWARAHGCRGIMSCSASPLQAWEAGAAAERDRVRDLVIDQSSRVIDEAVTAEIAELISRARADGAAAERDRIIKLAEDQHDLIMPCEFADRLREAK